MNGTDNPALTRSRAARGGRFPRGGGIPRQPARPSGTETEAPQQSSRVLRARAGEPSEAADSSTVSKCHGVVGTVGNPVVAPAIGRARGAGGRGRRGGGGRAGICTTSRTTAPVQLGSVESGPHSAPELHDCEGASRRDIHPTTFGTVVMAPVSSRGRGRGGRGRRGGPGLHLTAERNPSIEQACSDVERDPFNRSPLQGPGGTSPSDMAVDRTVEELEQELADAATTLNEYKKTIVTLERDSGERLVDMRALRTCISQLERENAALKAENEALKSTNDDLMVRVSASSNKKTKRCLEALLETIPSRYMGAALSVEKVMSKWASKEVAELNPEKEDLERLWKGRAELVGFGGIKTLSGVRVVPKCPISLSKTGDFFKSSTITVRGFLEQLCRSLVSTQESIPESERNAAVISIASNAFLLTKMRQSLSDCASNRKRMARDDFFVSMGYTRLASRFPTLTEEDHRCRGVEVDLAKERVLANVRGRGLLQLVTDIDCGWWRTGPVRDIHRSPLQTVWEDNHSESSLVLFRDKRAVQTYHTFLGYAPNRTGMVVETSILNLARLDAWVCTVVTLVSVREERGGRRQKLYSDTFHNMLMTSASQLVGTLRAYVEYWHPEELQIPPEADSLETREKAVLEMVREATLVVKSIEMGTYFIALNNAWFQTYVTTVMGDVHDCILATVDDEFSAISPLGVSASTYAHRKFSDSVGEETVSAELTEEL